MNRPIVIAVIGMLIGILWGLYGNRIVLSIVLCILILLVLIIKKNPRLKKFFRKGNRYRKVILSNKAIMVLGVVSILSVGRICILKDEYDNFQKEVTEGIFVVTVLSNPVEKEYEVQYRVRIESINGKKSERKIEVILKQKKGDLLSYGEKVSVVGNYLKPNQQRNTHGFNEQSYHYSIGIVGKLKASRITSVGKGKVNVLEKIANELASKIQTRIAQILPKEEEQGLLLGILLGNKEGLSKEVEEAFRQSSLAHLLAVSGMHVSYLVIGMKFILQKVSLSKKTTKMVSIWLLIFFILLVGKTSSVTRACIMVILSLASGFVLRKSDSISNLCTSLVLIFLENPFRITDIGLWLSFLATVGVLWGYPVFLKAITKQDQELMLVEKKNGREKLWIQLKETIALCVSAQLIILPILMQEFHQISILFIISNVLVGFVMGPLIFFSCISVFLSFFCLPIASILAFPVHIILWLLIAITKIIASFPFANLIVVRPKIWSVFVYYFLLCMCYCFFWLKQKEQIRKTQQKFLKKYILLKIVLLQHKKQIVVVLMVFILFFFFLNQFPKPLTIHFIDVGQGDATLIYAPYGKKVLIDTGGSKLGEEFDIGESVMVPYLLNQRVQSLDYLILSHFDADHCNGAIAVLEAVRVKELVITKQVESSKEYETIKEIAKQKKIKVRIVEKGDKLYLDKETYLEVLYPEQKLLFQDLNNNSMVVKLQQKNFSMLLTGDIEEIAEKAMLEKYKDTNTLQSTILKVAHHGSKSSSTEEFLNAVKPKIALIGVGEKNTFGHPNSGVLERLERIWE